MVATRAEFLVVFLEAGNWSIFVETKYSNDPFNLCSEHLGKN